MKVLRGATKTLKIVDFIFIEVSVNEETYKGWDVRLMKLQSFYHPTILFVLNLVQTFLMALEMHYLKKINHIKK